jgi:putative membrane protein
MLWLKALHIIALIAWYAGLFYLPRLYVYHASCDDQAGSERFKIMEHKLYWYIMTPAAVLTTLFGVWMLIDYAWAAYSKMGWLHAKLALVIFLFAYHAYLGKILCSFKQDQNKHSHKFYRYLNEVPTLVLILIVIFAVVKPF